MANTYNWHDIERCAMKFSIRWATEKDEKGEAKTFWDEFFMIFNVRRHDFINFESRVKRSGNRQGYIDVFWESRFLAEHKSAHKNKDRDFDAAFNQAKEYFDGIDIDKRPKFIAICSFQRFRLHDLESSKVHDFPLDELAQNIQKFQFIPDFALELQQKEVAANIEAATRMGKLHDAVKKDGLKGHDLELLLVRLLFCLFAEDTDIFPQKDQFEKFVLAHYQKEDANFGKSLLLLFEALNTKLENRSRELSEFKLFPYVNGGLFEKPMKQQPQLTLQTMLALHTCCKFGWSNISPAIFGSLFQSVMNETERRNLGAHYTSETNIRRLIEPLFMDELRAEFVTVKSNLKKLQAFHNKIGNLKFLDPACGCGNFLVVTYKALRLLEVEVIRILIYDFAGNIDPSQLKVNYLRRVRIHNFFGIEIEESSFLIAQTAMWLVDHQSNQILEKEFGEYVPSVPLPKGATIRHGNSLKLNWEKEFPNVDFIIGNPPFIGKKEQKEKKDELLEVFKGVNGAGVLDYVTCWYLKASQYMKSYPSVKTGFVSTNSISQGEQVGVLWNEILNNYEMQILFAHQTFKWTNEASGIAAVHCIVIGIAPNTVTWKKVIYEYEDISGEPQQINVKNINPYLVEGKNVFIGKRAKPIYQIPEMNYGSMPIDEGFLILSDIEKNELIKNEPLSAKYIRQYTGGDEFINNKLRWCLWLEGVEWKIIKKMPLVLGKINEVEAFRKKSNRPQTIKLAETPHLFGEIRQPKNNYLLIPKVSSENRNFIPIGFYPPQIIASGSCLVIPNADIYLFGILTSTMHMAWVKYVCGRMKSDYQYSASIVYNNYPFPQNVTAAQRQKVEIAAQTVLDIRQKYTMIGSSLANLYAPLSMPSDLLKAHENLDKAVDDCYTKTRFSNETKRIGFLFDLYAEYIETEKEANISIPKKGKQFV
jgi:type I restriction-modification system DNA methylase subunit